MWCPFCGNKESAVTDSRPAPRHIRRRRECTKCGQRFTTYEFWDADASPIMIDQFSELPELRKTVAEIRDDLKLSMQALTDLLNGNTA